MHQLLEFGALGHKVPFFAGTANTSCSKIILAFHILFSIGLVRFRLICVVNICGHLVFVLE